jgi:hypothetical protein
MQESTVYRSIQREAEEARDRVIALNLLSQGVSVEVISLFMPSSPIKILV